MSGFKQKEHSAPEEKGPDDFLGDSCCECLAALTIKSTTRVVALAAQ
jgi:hypothetical protein